MAKKLDDLEAFVRSLGPKRERIKLADLDRHIARAFGYSPYVLNSTKQALSRFGLIEPDPMAADVWIIHKPSPLEDE